MAIAIAIDFVDHVLSMPLETIRIEETMDTRATLTASIWDEGKALSILDRSYVVATDGGEPTFRGFVTDRTYRGLTPAGRWIDITCADWTIALDERLVGVPDGTTWQGPDTAGNFTNVDATAISFATDKLTIQNLFLNYLAGLPFAVDTSTYVFAYVPPGYLGLHPLNWSRTALRSALADMAQLAGANVHQWGDPAGAFHHQALVSIPAGGSGSGSGSGSLARMLPGTSSAPPPAPFGLSENPNGTTSFATVDGTIKVKIDASVMTEIAYITGSTDFVYSPTGLQLVPDGSGNMITISVPNVTPGGIGWYPSPGPPIGYGGRDITKRQGLVGSEAATLIERQADGLRAIRYSGSGILRASGKVWSDDSIFHIGQMLRVNYPSLECDGTYPIMHVITTYTGGSGRRFHELDWGDAPVARLTQRRPALQIPALQKSQPGHAHVVDLSALPDPLPLGDSGPWTIAGLFREFLPDGPAVKKAGLVVNFGWTYFDKDANPHPERLSLSPLSTTTDVNGTWQTVLTVTGRELGDNGSIYAFTPDA